MVGKHLRTEMICSSRLSTFITHSYQLHLTLQSFVVVEGMAVSNKLTFHEPFVTQTASL